MHKLILDLLGPAKRHLPLIALLMLFSGVLDLIGVGLVVPLILAFFDSTSDRFSYLSAVSEEALLAGLVAVFALKTCASFLLQGRITHFAQTSRFDLMARLLRVYLRQPLLFHIENHSSELMNRAIFFTDRFAGLVLVCGARLLADGIVFLGLVCVLLFIDPKVTIVLGGILGIAYLVLHMFVKRPLRNLTDVMANSQQHLIKATQDSLGAIEELKVLGHEEAFVRTIEKRGSVIRDANSRYSAFQTLPRNAVETIVLAFLAAIAIYFTRQNTDPAQILAMLSAFAMAGIRLIPASTSIMTNSQQLFANLGVISILHENLALPIPESTSQDTRDEAIESVELRHISFSYPGSNVQAVACSELDLESGHVYAISGESGAGKTTLAGILLGLIQADNGMILINGAETQSSWQQLCAYIPQKPFLLDGSIIENVTLGEDVSAIDTDRIWQALDKVQLLDVVEQLPEKLHSKVGEGGGRLSGGQRQRLALARAFYFQRHLIVLDESTSALDAKTEAKVLQAVRALADGAIVLVISHSDMVRSIADYEIQVSDGLVRAAKKLENVGLLSN